MAEIEPCPLCGALPCDWADNPHVARPSPARDEVLEEALRVAEVTIRLDAQRLQEAGRTTLQADAALAQIDAALKAQHPFTGGGDIPEGMVPWHGGDGPPPDWDHEGLVKLRSGLTMRQAEQMSPLEWAWRGGKWAHGDIIAYTPRPSTVREDATAGEFVMVPREPTEGMLAAVETVAFDNEDEHAMGCNVWNAMIAAAPKPTQPSIGMDEREKIAREVLAAEVASGTNETAKRWLAPGGGYGGATVSVRQALRAMHTFAHRLALSATPVDVGEGELPA